MQTSAITALVHSHFGIVPGSRKVETIFVHAKPCGECTFKIFLGPQDPASFAVDETYWLTIAMQRTVDDEDSN